MAVYWKIYNITIYYLLINILKLLLSLNWTIKEKRPIKKKKDNKHSRVPYYPISQYF